VPLISERPRDAGRLGIRYPMEVNLVGDSAETLRALAPLLRNKADRSWRNKIEKNVAAWWKDMDDRAHVSADPVNPQLVAWELSPRLPERAIVTSDSGSCVNWYARDIKIRRGMMCSLSGGLASMGAAVLCHRGEGRASRSAGYRPGGGRRDADE
jgi:pyruvate dehydrogenase (quinone)